MLQRIFRSVLLMGLFVSHSALAGPYDQFNDPEASRYAIHYAEQMVGKTPWEMFTDKDPSGAFMMRVKALHEEKGGFFVFANHKALKCRKTLGDYLLLHKTELRWKHGDLNAAQKLFAKEKIFEEMGKPLDAYIYLRSECGVTFEAATEVNKIIRESLRYPEAYPANAPEFPYD